MTPAEQMKADSDMIFTQITSGDFPTFDIANRAVCTIYVPDMTISRAGISHALGRLEKHYAAERGAGEGANG